MRCSCFPGYGNSVMRRTHANKQRHQRLTMLTCNFGKQSSGSQPDTERCQSSARALAAVTVIGLVLQPLDAGIELLTARPVQAHVAIDKVMQQQQRQAHQQVSTAGFEPSVSVDARGSTIRPASISSQSSSNSSNRRQQSPVASAASQALQQLSAAQTAAAAGDYQAALQAYSAVVQHHPDLALAEYARLGQAIMWYQLGDSNRSIVALEGQEISMRGYPEVHAALAAVLYSERPAQRLRAEQQWDIALEFDSRYQSVEWVAEDKHWPPALLQALEKFLRLQ